MATAMPIFRNGGQQQVGTGIAGTTSTVPVSTQQPLTAAPTDITQTNPYSAPGAVPTSTTLNGLPPGSVQTNGINWADGSNTVTGDFKDTYGAGTGKAITGVLQNLGTNTDAAVQATIANTQLAADKQFGNIQAQEAAAGITPNSSTAGLAAGDFYSTVNAGLQSTIAGMENQQEDTLLSALTGEGSAHGSDTGAMDTLGSVLGAIPGLSSGVSAGISALSPGTDTSWLDALGALA